MRALLLGLATVGWVGFIPYKIVPFKKNKGSGLLGSLAGWGLLWLLPPQGPALWAVIAAVLLLSIPVCGYAEAQLGHDDPRIVLDELVGIWIACLGVPRTIFPMLLALVFFRIFDSWKGPWARHPARLPGGLGVVADDVSAALIACLLTQLSLPLLPR